MCSVSGRNCAIVTENEYCLHLLKMDPVGPKPHHISLKILSVVHNTYNIILQHNISSFEALWSCNGQRNVLTIFGRKSHGVF